jgi:hypothetical protein
MVSNTTKTPLSPRSLPAWGDVLSFLEAELPRLSAPDDAQLPPDGRLYAESWGYWGRAAVVGFEATREPRYLRLVRETFEHLLEMRDDHLGLPDDVRGRVLPSWGVGSSPDSARTCYAAATALICLPILELLALAGEDAEADELCGDWLDSMHAAVRESLNAFGDEWRVADVGGKACGYLVDPEDHVLPVSTLNTYGAALVHLASLNDDEGIEERARQSIDAFCSALIRAADGSYSWPEQLELGSQRDTPPASAWSASIATELPLAAYRHGMRFGDRDMRCFADGFLRNSARRDQLESRAELNGAGTLDDASDRAPYVLLWARFSPFRPQIPAVLAQLATTNPSLGSDRWLRGPGPSILGLSHLLKQRTGDSEVLRRLGRPRPSGRRASQLDLEVLEKNRALNLKRRSMGPEDLDELFALLDAADDVVTVAEAVRRKDDRPERLVALRHDVDWDLDRAVLLGEMEAARGYRATFFMLHTDWYFRADPSAPLSSYLLDACHRLDALGHEIAMHNNAIAAALRWGGQPAEILQREIDDLRNAGFDVVGSVAHGEPLCHTYAFVNSEIFVECPRPRLGAPDRTIVHEDSEAALKHEVRLRPVAMSEMGLEYEAGYIGHSLYLTDSGSAWHLPIKDVRDKFIGNGGLLQILTHPAFWALDDENFTPRDPKVTAFAGSLLHQKLAR